MTSRRGRKRKTADHTIMLLESDQSGAGNLTDALAQRGHKVVWATSSDEAMRLLQDTVFIGSSFDGLLANCQLGDSCALRVIRDFRSEFSGAPVGLMTHQNDIATAIWANTKGIPILEKPLRPADLDLWLSRVESRSASA